ncbi:uncharacterized protein SCHCODRAFT_02620539 [Schizophyllum commune H4-8]|uniref:uncharacterized protein n=1 Tax=Schizophyllum commune (strain H4-8 / FGSC 9210) TaxID=578458 RepID=UPI00215E5896|nr:uncharacterized protein SCHCODRAFT_02620539 [Schizophyllum commune H4-8]KAI5895900.1 hypothetical protein SCHCODRAFT_02620539 [Schizophyllum commune H4-8]
MEFQRSRIEIPLVWYSKQASEYPCTTGSCCRYEDQLFPYHHSSAAMRGLQITTEKGTKAEDRG